MANAPSEARPFWRSRRGNEVAAATITAGAFIVLALWGEWWPFDSSPLGIEDYGADPSLWQFLLSDPTTLGFVRVGIVALALFVIASVPALLVAGRWLKGLGTGGISADEAADARLSLGAMQRQVATLRADLERVRKERDRAKEIARQAFEGVGKVIEMMDERIAELEKRRPEGRRREDS